MVTQAVDSEKGKAKSLFRVPRCKHATQRPSPDTYGSIVEIVVGSLDSRKTFHVYAGLLKHYSSYFRGALIPDLQQDTTKTLKLTDDDPRIFGLFYHWLYSGRLYTSCTEEGKIPLSADDTCALYLLGNARGIPELCNAAVDLLFQKNASEWAFPADCLKYVYENTLTDCNLRNLLVDLAVGAYGFATLRAQLDDYPKDFLIDVIMRSIELNKCPGTSYDQQKYLKTKTSELCNYHDHGHPHDTQDTNAKGYVNTGSMTKGIKREREE